MSVIGLVAVSTCSSSFQQPKKSHNVGIADRVAECQSGSIEFLSLRYACRSEPKVIISP